MMGELYDGDDDGDDVVENGFPMIDSIDCADDQL